MSGIRSYRQSSVVTADRMELIVMLYDGFLSFTQSAVEAVESGARARAGEATSQALAIVHELVASLDQNAEEGLVSSLSTLYEFVEHSLQEGNRHQDTAHYQNAAKVMSELRDGWGEASRMLRQKAA